MSNGYDNTNKGAIWPAKQRPTDKHPHFTGSLNVEGVEYWVNAWRKDENAKPGTPSLKFSIRPKKENQEVAKQAIEEAKKIVKGEVRGGDQDDPSDDIPF